MDSEVRDSDFVDYSKTGFENGLLSLLIGDAGFYDKYHLLLTPDLFNNQQFVVVLSLMDQYHDKFGKKPSFPVLIDLVENTNRPDVDELKTFIGWSETHPCDDSDYAGEKLIEWSRTRHIDKILKTHDGSSLELIEKINETIKIGSENCVGDFSTLDGEDAKLVRGETVATPFPTVNSKLMGGLERGDLGVVLAVVGGGKTTALVNVAREALYHGLFVVYFTFEDGSTKIKRRLLRSLFNIDMSCLVSNYRKVLEKVGKFLKNKNSQCYIRDLRTNQTKVSDLIPLLRSLEVTAGRKVDVVISDYADRFRPDKKRTEPRHEYREIFENCKALARSLNVVHWTASQVNKLRVGKDVVSMEHAAEAYGKVESADIVLGFGQTPEDELINRMTLNTAKLRDSEKCSKLSLKIDFDRQRMTELTDG